MGLEALTDGEKTERGRDFLTRCKMMADWEGGRDGVEGWRVVGLKKEKEAEMHINRAGEMGERWRDVAGKWGERWDAGKTESSEVGRQLNDMRRDDRTTGRDREVGGGVISQVNKFERHERHRESLRVSQDISEEEGIVRAYMYTVYRFILRFCFHRAVCLSLRHLMP